MPTSPSTFVEKEGYYKGRELSVSDEMEVTSLPTGAEAVELLPVMKHTCTSSPSPTDTLILGSTDEEDTQDFGLTPPVTKGLEGNVNTF